MASSQDFLALAPSQGVGSRLAFANRPGQVCLRECRKPLSRRLDDELRTVEGVSHFRALGNPHLLGDFGRQTKSQTVPPLENGLLSHWPISCIAIDYTPGSKFDERAACAAFFHWAPAHRCDCSVRGDDQAPRVTVTGTSP